MKLSARHSSFCDLLEGTQDETAETSTFYVVQMVQVTNQPKSVNVNICTLVLIQTLKQLCS